MGEITLENSRLRLTVDTVGAQMMSIRTPDGREYLWQGDARYWSDRAPVLFPFVGRLTENAYCYAGRRYSMGIHGFAARQEFDCRCRDGQRLVLERTDNAETRAQYPFAFSLQIAYQLADNQIRIACRVENRDTRPLPFGIGGHPGFRVPLEEGERFEDYYLEFAGGCRPDRVGFTPQLFLSGRDEAYPLEEGRYLPLRHDLFEEDAVVLKNMSREVALRSRVSPHGVRVRCPDMPYLGLWHAPKTDAPYVCIEPWSSLPARQDVVEDLACRSDLIQLAPGRIYDNTWSITVF